jgi:hypothetical protein
MPSEQFHRPSITQHTNQNKTRKKIKQSSITTNLLNCDVVIVVQVKGEHT